MPSPTNYVVRSCLKGKRRALAKNATYTSSILGWDTKNGWKQNTLLCMLCMYSDAYLQPQTVEVLTTSRIPQPDVRLGQSGVHKAR